MHIDHKFFEFIRFCIVGTVALVIQYGVFYILFNLTGLHNFAYLLSYLLSAIANFVLTIRYTFKVDFSQKKLLGFFACHIFNLVFQLFLLNLFIWLGLSEVLAPFPVYAIAVPSNFVLVRFVMVGFRNKT